MKVTRKTDFSINNKVIHIADVLRLVDIFVKLLANPEKQEQFEEYVTIELLAIDGTRYEIDDTSTAELEKILNDVQIKQFDIRARSIKYDSYLMGTLSTAKYTPSFLHIQSTNDEKFDAFRSKFADYVGRLEDQDNFYLRHRGALEFTTRVILGVFLAITFFRLLDVLIPLIWPNFGTAKPIEPLAYRVFLNIMLYGIIGYMMGWPVSTVARKLDEIWPPVELRLGPIHLDTIQKKKQIYKSAWTNFGAPLIVAALIWLASLIF